MSEDKKKDETEIGKALDNVVGSVEEVNVPQTIIGSVIGFFVWYVLSKVVKDNPAPSPNKPDEPLVVVVSKEAVCEEDQPSVRVNDNVIIGW